MRQIISDNKKIAPNLGLDYFKVTLLDYEKESYWIEYLFLLLKKKNIKHSEPVYKDNKNVSFSIKYKDLSVSEFKKLIDLLLKIKVAKIQIKRYKYLL